MQHPGHEKLIFLCKIDNFYCTKNSITINFLPGDMTCAYDYPRILGVTNSHYWIWKQMYKMIDEGGAYRMKAPIVASSRAPKFDEERARAELHSDYSLVRELYRQTPHPKFIINLSKKFIQEYISTSKDASTKFIGIHWRFNVDFLGKSAVHPEQYLAEKTTAENEALLQQVKALQVKGQDITNDLLHGKKGIPEWVRVEIHKSLKNPGYFIEKLLRHIETVIPERELYDGHINGTESSLSSTLTIFISSPQNIAQYFEDLMKTPFKTPSGRIVKIITSNDTLKFFNQQAKQCQIFEDYKGDILSTFEKEILINSFSFYRARPSNWSFNVQGQRFGKLDEEKLKYDRVIYDVFMDRTIRK